MPQPTAASSASDNPGPSRRKRILWLYTQPEHYFKCLMEDFAAGTGYKMPGSPPAFEFIPAFSYRVPGQVADDNTSQGIQSVFLRPQPGKEGRAPAFREHYHIDWRQDLLPLNFDAAIVGGYGSRTARELIAYCHRQKIPVILWSDSNLRGERGRSLKSRLRRCLKRRYLRPIINRVDYQLTSNTLGVAYWRYYGAAKNHIAVCPYYADYRAIDAAHLRPRGEILAHIGLQPTDHYLFSAARLVPVKGLDLMIRAFRAGRFADAGHHYVIAGQGPLEAELKALAGDALGKSIHFVGFQPPRDNLALMAHADLMILPSRYEPHGIVVAEAMCAGTPVVASDVVGAAHDLVTPGESGFLFRSEDAADLQRKLTEALAPSRLAALRPAARRGFESWYAKTSPIRVIPEILAKMLAERP